MSFLIIEFIGGLVTNSLALLADAGHMLTDVGALALMNIRGAFLHMVADTMGSVGAVVGGFVIWKWHWTPIDPLISLVIVILILYSSVGLLKEATNVLLEATPSHLDYSQIKQALENIPSVRQVHDLHIWTITTGMPSLSAHLRIKTDQSDLDSWIRCLDACERLLADQFGIHHSTLQIEPENFTHRQNLCHPT
ncbi:cation transporter [candidate division KSB1 bacterium]|nr:cation transporter [candidate division KSB1 bacterium]